MINMININRIVLLYQTMEWCWFL